MRYSTVMITGRRHRAGRLHALAAFIAIFAALLRAAIAPGWMPDPAAASGGAFTLVICTPAGPLEVPGPRGGTPSSDGLAVLDLCPYAASTHLATLSEPETVFHVRFERAVEWLEADGAFIAAFPRRWHARAPPVARALVRQS
ncbi:MAG: DUF2946 family protein [Rhodomicrobiaceae bacterium]